jgi:hypothetical protein
MSKSKSHKRFFKRRKGGSTYFSDIVTSIGGIGFMIVSVFIAGMMAFFVSSSLEVNVYGAVLYNNPSNENALMSFSDITDQQTGLSMLDLITYSVWYNSANFTLAGNKVNLTEKTPEVMSNVFKKYHYLYLDINGEEIPLSGRKTDYLKVRTSTAIIANNKIGELILIS